MSVPRPTAAPGTTAPAATDPSWWVAVASAASLGREPLRVQREGEALVLWRDDRGAPAALQDRCPHRGASLSLGRVEDGAIECAYHGWRFAPDGRCRSIPARPGLDPPQRARAWRAHEAEGLVWVAGDAAPAMPPALGDVPRRRVLCGPYEVQTSAPRVIENFLDTAHFAFVHAQWLGDRAHAEVPPYEVRLDAEGRPGVDHYRAWQPRASTSAAGGAWVDYRYQVLGPHAALLVKQAQGAALAEAYAVLACPLDDDHTRLWFVLATSDEATPDDELRAFQERIFGQDRAILESQRPRRLPLGDDAPGAELHGPADRLSVAYRRYLRSCGIACGVT